MFFEKRKGVEDLYSKITWMIQLVYDFPNFPHISLKKFKCKFLQNLMVGTNSDEKL